MKRAHRNNLLLLGIVVVLGALVYLQIAHESATRPQPLTALDPATISRLEIDCANCRTRRFERTAGGWMMREPYALPADDKAIARLLSIATLPVQRSYRTDELDLVLVGLAPAQMHLQLDGVAIEVGASDALQGDRYLRIGSDVIMVADRFSPLLLGTPESELDRQLVPRGQQLQQVHLDGLERADLRGAWAHASAIGIVPVDPRDPQPTTSSRIELSLDDGNSRAFLLHRSGGEYRARDIQRALDYVLATAQAEQLLAPPGTERARLITPSAEP